jgi:hypothetical protein
MESRQVFDVTGGKFVISNRIIQANQAKVGQVKVGKEWMIAPILWSKVRAKATLERKTMREVIFESLKQYIRPVETAAGSHRKKD